jgi:hypothetical protein
MGVKGILPLYSNAVIPFSRRDVADFLVQVDGKKDQLTPAETGFLQKFEREFAHEINPSEDDAAVLFRDGFQGVFSQQEKYLYTYSDTSVALSVELLGGLEYRRASGDTYGGTHVSLEEHGGRIRGTVKARLGYFLQGTDGTIFGDKEFALADPRLRGNWKLQSAGSTNFDFTDAYLRADVDWFNIEFGKERFLVGTGYADRLLLSDNAPEFDAIRIDAHYKSVRFVYIHGSLVDDSTVSLSRFVENKYFALHRIQLSFFDRLNLGLSEMIVYQRASPEFAYLNPINFYKSAEHAAGDRDNAFLNLDFELFPFTGYKLYGTWLIDDIDFSKIGTGWWGNEFGWQGGVYAAGPLGISNLDADVEYTLLEPYVYSNRTFGDDYTHNSIGLGHHLDPNSDEWRTELSYRPLSSLRVWMSFAHDRHGENIVQNGQVVRNVGGSALVGHQPGDSDVAVLLDGNLVTTDRLDLRATYEPITNFFLTGEYQLQDVRRNAPDETLHDHFLSFRVQVEY